MEDQPQRQVFHGVGERREGLGASIQYSSTEEGCIRYMCNDPGPGEPHQRTGQPYWDDDNGAGAGEMTPVDASASLFHWEKAAGLRYNQNSPVSCGPGVRQVVICSRQGAGRSVVKLLVGNQGQADEQCATNSICGKW
jgi:hypothetical protein